VRVWVVNPVEGTSEREVERILCWRGV
jgi:hypothetical protein